MVDWAQVMNEPPPLDVRAYRTDVKQNESYGRFGQVFDVLPDEQRVPLGDFKQAIAADHRVLGSVFGQEAVENNDRWVAYGLSNIVTEEAILFGTQNCWPPRSPKLLSMGVYGESAPLFMGPANLLFRSIQENSDRTQLRGPSVWQAWT